MQKIFGKDDWKQGMFFPQKTVSVFFNKNWAYLLQTIKIDDIIKRIHSSSPLR